MKQLANHILEYIDTATTGILTPHLIPVPDLQKMLYQIESELPPNMHLLITSSLLQISSDTRTSGGEPILITDRCSHPGQSTADSDLPNHQSTSTRRKLFDEIHHGH